MARLPKRHATFQSFKRGAVGGSGPFKYRSRLCIECQRWQRTLMRGMCDACYRRVKYNTDPQWRAKERERTKKYERKAQEKVIDGRKHRLSPPPAPAKKTMAKGTA